MGPRIASVQADAGPDPSGPGIWRLGPRLRYSQRVPARAREKLGVRERGRTVETRPIPILSAPPRPPQLQGSLRCKAKGAFAQGTGRNSARKRKKKNPAGLQRRPASLPKQQPHSTRASHSPTRRCCASTAGAGTTTAARSGPRPGPAPTTPRARPFADPPPSPPTSLVPPGSLRVFAIFFSFVFGHACGVKL